MSTFLFDLRASVRLLRQRPLLAFLSIGTLGAGLGAASALFAILHAIYLRPLPLDAHKEVVVVRATLAAEGLDNEPLSRPEMVDLLESNSAVAAYGGLRDWTFPLLGDGRREPVDGLLTTAGVFAVFGVKPHLGRLYGPADDQPGRNRVAVVSFASWKRRFGGDPQVVGRSLQLGNDLYTVIGVLPERMTAPSFASAELWAPLSNDPDYARGRKQRNLIVYARLTGRSAFDALRSELLLRAGTLAQQYADTNEGWSARAVPLLRYELAAVLPRLTLLTAATLLLAVMGCANVASLIFADSMGRRTEYGLRAALGGSAWRLFQQLFTDNLMLCLAGGAAATGVATALLLFAAPFAASQIPRFEEIRPDAWALALPLAAAIALAAIFAAVAVLWSGRGEPAEHIRAGGGGLGALAPRSLSASLVTSQIALAFVLLVIAVLFARGYWRTTTAEPGFDPRGVVLLRVQAVGPVSRTLLVAGGRTAAAGLTALPGAASATIASSGPMFGGDESLDVATESMTRPLPARFANVGDGFFTCMRIPLLAGRDFEPSDDGRRSSNVTIVSRALAERLFLPGQAVGKVLFIGGRRTPHQIVGVAGDNRDLRGDRTGVQLFFPFAQDPRATFYLVVRSAKGHELAPAAAAQRVRASLPNFMLLSATSLRSAVDDILLAPRLQLALLVLFALGAAVLSIVAVYGMVTLAAATRSAEIGLRLALGATPRAAGLLLLREIAAAVAAGLACGSALLAAAASSIRALLQRGAAGDPLSIGVAAGFIALLALAASWRSVRAIARQEPIEAIRAIA